MPTKNAVPPLKTRGFTLVELLITISIAAILLSAGLPAFNDFIRDNRLQKAAAGFVGDLAAARAEAARTFLTVRVCPSTAGTSCDGTDWATGRIVYVDGNGNGSVESAEIIRWSAPLDGGVVPTATGFATLIAFRPTGAAAVAGSIDLCDSRSGAYGRRVEVNAAGRVTLRQVSC